jgi:galactonate dehydratase
LKITDLKTFIVNRGGNNGSNYVFCKIYTDQGLTGLGEGSVTSKEATVAAAIEEHKRYLVGKDAGDIEMHWQAMYRWPRWRGGPILNSAISAVEIALWDILGQALGQPIWKLVGGKAREKVLMYVHAGGRHSAGLRAKLRPSQRGRLERLQGGIPHHSGNHHRSDPLGPRRHRAPQSRA